MTYPLTTPARSARLEGPERGLDAAIGLIILVAEVMIGVLTVGTLYELGVRYGDAAAGDQLEFGFGFAVFGGGAIVVLTTLIYLVRLLAGRRSWGAPLWGLILMSVALGIGWGIMVGAV